MKTKIFVFILFAYSFNLIAQTDNPFEVYKANWIGKQAPDFRFKDIAGKEFLISDLEGKVVLLNMWFINCPGCKVEYPGLQTLKSRFEKIKKSDKIVLLSLALDSKEKLSVFLKNNPLDFYNMAETSDISKGMYQVLGFPTNFIIDQKGIIKHIKIGGSKQSADDIEYEILELLK